MTTLIKKDSIHRSPSRLALLLIPFVFACFALSPTTRALLPPPAPDGGYPGFTTAEGQNALFNLTSGVGNTAVGATALNANTTGGYNTAIGCQALLDSNLRSSKTHKRSAPRPMEAILEAIRRKGKLLFLALLLAASIRQLVSSRSEATLPDSLTLPLALGLFLPTSQTEIQPLAPLRC